MPSGASTAALAALALLPLALAGAPADASLNAAGLPLMTPTSASAANHTYYFEIPIDPVGLLVMLHRCGRSAEDFWPPSGACPECIGGWRLPASSCLLQAQQQAPAACAHDATGAHRCRQPALGGHAELYGCMPCVRAPGAGMPEAVSISRQALARGYALLAINSFNRTVGSLGRCWRWGGGMPGGRQLGR